MGKLASFLVSPQGNIALTVALIAPIIVGAGGLAVDYSNYYRYLSSLQNAADAAALATARELSLTNMSKTQVLNSAENYASSNFYLDQGKDKHTDLKTQATIDAGGDRVTVELSFTWTALFGKVLGYTNMMPIEVQAIAQFSGDEIPICVIGLDPDLSETVSLDSNARLTATNCSVYSNSSSPSGMSSKSNAIVKAGNICSAGGRVGGGSNYNPLPITDCPPVQDPLENRTAPTFGNCDETNQKLVDKKTVLYPGVYCGGLTIDGNSNVTFEPGTYVIKDGTFNVDSNSKITGYEVGFFLTGKNATFRFASNADVTLSAPLTGPMAGLLFYEDRNAPKYRNHEILSNYARNMVGTVYLPRGNFVVDADNPIADKSEYTAIVARRVILKSGPNLVLNTDYANTNVPVPDGIAGGETRIRLVK